MARRTDHSRDAPALVEATSFALPDGLDLTRLGKALSPRRSLGPASVTRVTQVVYDTFDGRLRGAGYRLRAEGGRLELVADRDGRRVGVRAAMPGARVFAADLPPGPLTDLIVPLLGPRALQPLARLRTTHRTIPVLDDEGKTVVRLVIEEAIVEGPAVAPLAPRLGLQAVRGYDADLTRVRRAITRTLALAPAETALTDEALLRIGLAPGGVSSAVDVSLARGEPAGVCTARLCVRLAEVIEANLPGTLADIDSEYLHDLRVAVRRTRSLQRELREVFPPERLPAFRDGFRRLQAITGPTRDLDVYVLEFDAFRSAVPASRREDLDLVRDVLDARRRRERRRMTRELRAPATEALLSEWRRILEEMLAGSAGGPGAAASVEAAAGARIRRVHRRMVRSGRAITLASPAESLHRLRKRGKELRYLLELFGGLFPKEAVAPLVKRLKALQDTLGRHQDREIQAEMFAALGDEVRGHADGARTLLAMGQLLERLEAQKDEARAEFAERFEAFVAATSPETVTRSFR